MFPVPPDAACADAEVSVLWSGARALEERELYTCDAPTAPTETTRVMGTDDLCLIVLVPASSTTVQLSLISVVTHPLLRFAEFYAVGGIEEDEVAPVEGGWFLVSLWEITIPRVPETPFGVYFPPTSE